MTVAANIENVIRALLIADPTVTGLVGTRIYPEVLPQNPTYPAITYDTITEDEDSHDIVRLDRIQYSCFATTSDGAKALRRAVKDCLKGYTGVYLGFEIIRILPLPGGIVSRTSEGTLSLAMATRDFSIKYRGKGAATTT